MKRYASNRNATTGNKRTTAYKRLRTVQSIVPFRPRVPRPLVNVGMQGLPPRLSNKMRYAAVHTITMTAQLGTHNFSCNGMYDPDITGSGHQPHYFDQIAALYNHYTVTASRMTIAVQNLPSEGVSYGIFVDDDSTPAVTNRYDPLEREGCVWDTSIHATGAGKKLSLAFNASKYFGPNVMNGIQYQGNIANNPTEQAHFILWCMGTANQIVEFTITIDYEATWSELKSVTSS